MTSVTGFCLKFSNSGQILVLMCFSVCLGSKNIPERVPFYYCSPAPWEHIDHSWPMCFHVCTSEESACSKELVPDPNNTPCLPLWTMRPSLLSVHLCALRMIMLLWAGDCKCSVNHTNLLRILDVQASIHDPMFGSE